MKRRGFIKKAGAAALGAATFPYILPSGRLFAATGSQLAEHVVFVLFAGGVRHQEAIGMRYLADSQYPYSGDDNVNVEGNIMPNMLNGAAPESKVVYGMDPPDGGTLGSIPIPSILGNSLQNQGTIFSEMTCRTAGHYLGLSALVSGNYATTQGLRNKPVNPTIFEYVRRYLNAPASKVWFVGNGIGNSTPLLNYSVDPDFGANYGANFFAPRITFGDDGEEYLADAKNYHPEEEMSLIYEMKHFLDNSFITTGGVLPGIGNTEAEKYDIKQFMNYLFDKTTPGVMAQVPGGAGNTDVLTMVYATEVMAWFKPNITVINMSGVDACHGNFTDYLRSLHRADYALGYVWDFIQSQIPEMADNTVLIAAPECGRNSEPNSLLDFNDWFAYDHSDENALRNFAMMVGPGVPAGEIRGTPGNPAGDTAQCLLAAAEVLGIKSEVNGAGKLYSPQSLFDLL